MKRKKIIPQMFDVRPVDKSGSLDLERIKKIEQILRLSKKLENSKKNKKETGNVIRMDEVRKIQEISKEIMEIPDVKAYQWGKLFDLEDIPLINEFDPETIEKILWQRRIREEENYFKSKTKDEKKSVRKHPLKWFRGDHFSILTGFWENGRIRGGLQGSVYTFGMLATIICLVVFSMRFLGRALEVRDSALANGAVAYQNLSEAKAAIAKSNFQESSLRFGQAEDKFQEISSDMDSLGRMVIETGRFFPFLSKATSGKYLSESGKDISRIGVLVSGILSNMDQLKNPLQPTSDSISFLEIFQKADDNLKEVKPLLEDLENNLDKINLEDIPEGNRQDFIKLKSKLPEIQGFVSGFIDDSQIFVDVLGGNGPRKYLFLFENNNEMRATGGFIGTYGILDIFNGRIKRFFVDGIFNPDGQLKEKIVPPAPIQKISAAWSLHDSNWFPDFPTSAEKARWFYEKTGGPTVDGVIAMTPVVMQKLLSVTGPIEMPEYGVTIDQNNFMEKVQDEVETNYDKELNQPKKILSDLAPKILDRIFNARSFSEISQTMNILLDSLNEKHILIYANNIDIENKLSEEGWSGEILDTSKDYLSVINTNINGYKTDGVIEEKINHQAEIQEDGSIVDEVTISRHHNGGSSQYEWFNKVNADYMRVYVPEGSQLISAEGQTREFNSPPLDYNTLGFKHDPQVKMEEQSIQVDEATGTRVYEDFGKTVFANWVYVSPQETVVVKYKYLLPFKVDILSRDHLVDTYSLLVQKQSGSLGSDFNSQLTFPQKYKILWKYPDEAAVNVNASGQIQIGLQTDLKRDKFLGIALILKTER